MSTEQETGLALDDAYAAGLPEITVEDAVGVAYLLTRSHEPGCVDAWQLVCPLQSVPERFNQLQLLGSFAPRLLLDWAYASVLQSSALFELPDLWDYVRRSIGLRASDCWILRPVLGDIRGVGEPWASMSEEELLSRLPNLPRVA